MGSTFSIMVAQFLTLCIPVAQKLIVAVIAYFVGKWIIGKILKMIGASKTFGRLDAEFRSFGMSALKGALYVILLVIIISIMGIPMASVIAVIASAGVAVGLALQGALSNLAGGIMLVLFKPFRVGDYVDAAGVSGTVKEISLLYTVIMTLDNRRVTVPNGTLMNANVVDYSTEPLRRVDLTFACAKSEKPAAIQNLMIEVMNANEKVLQDPAPFARLSGGSNEAMEFTVRAWCKNEDYWDVYFDLTQSITEQMGAAGVNAPAVRVITN